MINTVRKFLYDPMVRDVNVDDNSLLEIHRRILREKPLMKSTFETFYRDMADACDRFFKVDGTEVELGTGVGFFKTLRPKLVTSDVRKGPNIDIELDAQKMELRDQSVRCFYAINVFHHLPDPEGFFEELKRVLLPGGGCILIEPSGSFVSGLLHRYLHTDEHFDLSAKGWKTANIEGPMSGANQALSHIVFHRDMERFEELYGSELEVVCQGYELNGLRYLISGGLNFRQLLPSFMDRPLKSLESSGRFLASKWALHEMIVIRKKNQSVADTTINA